METKNESKANITAKPEERSDEQIPAVMCRSCSCFYNKDFDDKNYGQCVKLTLYIHGEDADDNIHEPDHYVVHGDFGCIYHIDNLTLKRSYT